MLPRYRVKSRDGQVDREMELAASEWKPGDKIHTGPREVLTVVEVPPCVAGELPVLIVE